MRYNKINSSFFKGNRKELNQLLEPNSIVVLYSSDEYPRNGDQTFPFRQNSDTYYLSGIDQEESILLLSPNNKDKKLREILFIKKVDRSQIIWHGKKLSIEKAQKTSGITNVKHLDEFENTLNSILKDKVDHIYYWEINTPKFSTGVPYKAKREVESLKRLSPNYKYIPISPLTTQLRLIKKEEELDSMKKAVSITKEAYKRVLIKTKPNVMEYEIEAEITYTYIKNGATGHAYSPIVASGVNACVLHYETNDQLCKDGDLLLMDFGAEYGNYAADCSRTIPVNGKFTDRQAACYQAVLDVYKSAKKLFVPGNTIDIINSEVNKMMEEEMVKLGLFSRQDVNNQNVLEPIYTRYFMHGTSHFIGLDVHDVGDKQTVFEKGMVLTCEPGLYIEEEGIGIRIETNIIVDETPIDLMADFPVEIKEIEECMKS